MNNTDFICAYFGKDWTITARGFGSAKQAEKHGLYMMPTAGVFGFAVIAEDKDGWVVDRAYSILNFKRSDGNNDCNLFNLSYN